MQKCNIGVEKAIKNKKGWFPPFPPTPPIPRELRIKNKERDIYRENPRFLATKF